MASVVVAAGAVGDGGGRRRRLSNGERLRDVSDLYSDRHDQSYREDDRRPFDVR
jgi:hypothetical protein